MIQNHPAVEAAATGKITPAGVACYLASLHFLFTQTVPHMIRAEARANELGLSRLPAYFRGKVEEEEGHERWAEEDIAEFERANAGLGSAAPAPAVRELVQLLAETIERDPRLYVAYAVAIEYFTVLTGPTWIEALSTGCGVSTDALTSVSKHVAADQHHAAAGFAQIDELLGDAKLFEPVQKLLSRVFELIWAMLEQASSVGLAPAA
jgi:pyrroloquinoline quinone (PQQ) biosynthesis protein C